MLSNKKDYLNKEKRTAETILLAPWAEIRTIQKTEPMNATNHAGAIC
jgi:hypothetical protein